MRPAKRGVNERAHGVRRAPELKDGRSRGRNSRPVFTWLDCVAGYSGLFSSLSHKSSALQGQLPGLARSGSLRFPVHVAA